MKKFIITVVLILSFIANSFGQNPSEPTVSTYDGEQKVCIKGDKHDLRVKINLPLGYDINKVDSFVIKWGYPGYTDIKNGGVKVIQRDKFNTIYNFIIDFKFPGIYSNCEPFHEGMVRLDTYIDGDPKNNLFAPTFRVPPTAKISDTSFITCVGQPFTFDGSKSCPTNITEYEWTIEGQKYYGKTYTHTFTTSGTKTIKLKVTNPCGFSEDKKDIFVRPLPIAKAKAKAVIKDKKYVICLNDIDNGKLLLDGSDSKNTDIYEWTSTSSSVSFSDERILGVLIKEKKWAHFTTTGIYDIILTVDSDCNRPDYDTIKVEVIDRIPVYLNPINDTCGPIMYSPPSNVSGTIYTVDGKKVTSFPMELKAGNHIVEAKYENDCGPTFAKIEFKVFEPVVTKITSPSNGVIICRDNKARVNLEGIGGGLFSGTYVIENDKKYYFIPEQVGNYKILYTTGSGKCMRSDSINIEVIDNVPLDITPQSDACNTLNYTPGKYNSAAKYTINGTLQSSFPKTYGPGTYIVVGVLNNACGSDQTVRDTFNVTTPQNVTIISPLKDTTVCKSDTPFELKGSAENGVFTGHPNILKDGKKWMVTPSQSGTYTITFTEGIDACKSSKSVKITVIENQVLTLTPQEDVCSSLNYSIKSNNIPGATFTLDGSPFSGTKTLGVGKYIVYGKFENACGPQEVRDTFEVKAVKQVKILEPNDGKVLCLNQSKIEIKVSDFGGEFSPNTFITEDNKKYYFNPTQAGNFAITYTFGKGVGCSTNDKLNISVIENQVLIITSQADVCTSLDYSVKPNSVSGAIYTLNGDRFSGTKKLGVGKYKIIGKFESACGVQEVTDEFEVKAVKQVEILEPKDESVFCLNQPQVEIKVSASGGIFNPATNITEQGGKYFFNPSKIEDIILKYTEGEGDGCSTSDEIKISVLGENPLKLNPQADVCNQLSYTPNPYQDFATYKINGVEYDKFPVTLNKEDSYKVEAKYENACGTLIVKDTFNITVPQDVKFTSHSKPTTICKTQGREEITVSVLGGVFSKPKGFIEEAGKYYFDPVISGLGDFTLTYEQGIGDCIRKDTLVITVIESIPLELPAQEDICNSFAYTPKGFDEKATYTINGKEIKNEDFPVSISEANTYIIQAEMTNECGTLTLMDTFELFVPMDVKIISHPKDTTVCVSEEKIKISGSSTRGRFVQKDYLTILQSDEAELDISAPGKYEIVFEQGFGDCYTSDTLIVTVEDTKILALDKQQDACEGLEYTPQPFNEFAEYQINGKVVTDFPTTLSKGTYEIVATLVDVCETKILKDTFQVYLPSDLKIISDKEERVCVNSDPVLLKSTIEGAVFDGEHLRQEDESLFFDPVIAGLYTITLTLPLYNCTLNDEITIEVIGLAPQIEDIFVCQEILKIELKGEPEGGTWASNTCPDCVKGDIFTFNKVDSVYHYSYTLTNDIGCEAVDNATITILSPLSDFELNTPPCSSGIDFDLSKSVGQEFLWEVDGENTDAPPFIGLTTGKHIITMTAKTGDCFHSSFIEVFIIDPVENAADFILPHDEHCTPYQLIPEIKSPYYDFLDYKWTINFNGGTTEIDTYKIDGGLELVNPTPFRIMAQVIFSAGNVCGMVETIDSVEIIGIPLAIIGIDSSRYGCSPYTIAISNIAQGEMDECIWRVNGKVIYTCDPYIYQTFVANDTVTIFPIELEVSNECGRHKAYDTITVSPPWINVFFNTDEYEVCPNTPITFEDATTPAPIYWKWDFGNGKYSDEQNPTIEYSQPGTYYVTLKASTGCGYDSITRPIVVKNAPIVDFILPVYACQNQSSDSIINLSDYVNQKFVWDFGNGIKDSINAHPRPVFDEFGNNLVSLTVTDKKSGCTTSLSKTYEIKAQPQINILLDSLICYGKELQIPNNTLYANDYTWYYDQIAVHSGKDPLIIFKETGEHHIQLVATYNDKCVDSISKVVFVRRCDVYIPNLFTPNNDGKDDFFTAYGGVNTSLIRSVKIFDRWGEMVFSKENYPLNVEYLGWDGSVSTRSKSYGLNSTVFIYMIEIEFTDGTTEVFSGDITLLR